MTVRIPCGLQSRPTLAVLLTLLAPGALTAQNPPPPSTDIHVAELLLAGPVVEIQNVLNATDRPGYDNQPWFAADGSGFWYSSFVEDQTDIFFHDLDSGTSRRITETPWGEYSPSSAGPNDDILAVGGGGDPVQMGLWRYSAAGEPLAALTDPLPNAGYYGIANDTLMFVWINDEMGTLAHVDRRDGTITPFRDRVAPGPPKLIPGDDGLSIVEPNYVGQMLLMRLDPQSLAVTPIAPAVGSGWDHAWTPDGRVLMGEGNAIFAHDPTGEEGWVEVARFPGLGTITRIAVSPRGDRIAFVATRQ